MAGNQLRKVPLVNDVSTKPAPGDSDHICEPRGIFLSMPKLSRLLAAALWVLAIQPPPTAAQELDLRPDAPLPIDPRVRVGTLDNGLRYYIRVNGRPEQRAELRLVVNAGSVLEDDHERGVAHFVEHMAFNGTRNFERQALVEYLEGIGMRFGPDVNAYTSFDETVYMLTIPTDSQEIVQTAFQILEDWATGVLFDPEEVDKERGVVIEEWRGGRGADARIQDEQFPVLLAGSRYAERLPIGLPEILETVSSETLRGFYQRWYRPDLMAVVAVGDFDPDEIDALIRRHFGRVPRPAEPVELPRFPVPGHSATRFHAATDPELSLTRVEILTKLGPRETATVSDFHRSLIEGAFNGMLNQRFGEITQKPNAPFLGAFSGRIGFLATADVYVLGAVVPEGGVTRGLHAVLTEAARVSQHGFTESELERHRLNQLRGLERAYAERERTNSEVYADGYVNHFLRGSAIPGIEWRYAAAQRLMPEITVSEVDRLAGDWITEENRVILVSAPEDEEAELPSERELRQVLTTVAGASVDPYDDATPDAPLVAQPPAPAAIVAETVHEEVDVVEWRLANGVRVLLKTTDFRDDEVLMRAWAPGGTSLAPDDSVLAATLATQIVTSGGAGQFSLTELQRVLAGKAVFVSPWIGGLEQGFNGSASPQDLETLFQLTWLYFTAPRKDSEAVGAMLDRVRAVLVNRGREPDAVYGDTVSVTMAQYHPRSQPPAIAAVDAMDIDWAMRFYRERFSDAAGFTFVFVGNLDRAALRPLVQTYLGGLPSTGTVESWRDTGVRPPDGMVEKVVRQGIEPRSHTQIYFTGPTVHNRENNYAMRSLADVLRIRLREVLREDLGGTYGVQVSGNIEWRPEERYTFRIAFGAAPERLDELVAVAFEEIARLREEGPREQDLSRVREIQRRERETSLRENGWWLNQIASYDRLGWILGEIVTYERLIEGLTADLVREAAREWLRAESYVRVSLFPREN